jgi:hypothetical protein
VIVVEGPVASLSLAAALGRPVTMAESRMLDVPGALGGLFPEGGLRRGSVVTVVPDTGGVSLALALAAAATGEGGWVAALGLPSLGVVAAAELGVRLDRMALVPDPGGRWAAVGAALLDGVDLLLLGPIGRARATDARRLAARAREHGTVVVVLAARGTMGWPEAPDFRLTVAGATWEGLSAGHGRLQARRLEVTVTGRRAAARERQVSLWLPGPEEAVQVVDEVPGPAAAAG